MNSFGNLVVNVLLAVLSFGSLKIALSSIIIGVANGAKSSTFPLATKPFGFLIITGLWLGFGLLMLYALWRGIFKPKGLDDSDLPDDLATVPQARQTAYRQGSAQLQSDPQAAVVKSPGGKASFEQFLQRAKPAQSSSHSARCSTPLPVSRQALPSQASELTPRSREGEPLAESLPESRRESLPEPLHLYKSRVKVVFWVIAMTLYTVASGYGAFFFSYLLGQKLGILLFSVTALAYLIFLAKSVRAWRWQGPALSIDKFGITDHYRGRDQIPWTAIKGVRVGDADAAASLMLQFARVEQVRAYFGSGNLPFALLHRIFYNGFEGRLQLTSLAYDQAQVIKVSKAFLRHANR